MAITTSERATLLLELERHAALILALPVDAPAPPPAPAPAPAPATWQPLVGENNDFTLAQEGIVRFGTGTTWAEATLPAGTHTCGPWGVWGDPAPGVAKTCELLVGSAPAPTPAPPAPTPPPPPAPTPPAPPPGPGTTLYFSAEAHASNSNPGTMALPKRSLSGLNVNALPAGSTLLFRRGDTWDGVFLSLENMNTSAESPLVFDAYGSGAKPAWRTPSNNMIHFGGNWNNTSNDGGYVIRNIKLDGMGTAVWGLWFVHTIRNVLVEKCEITGFAIGVNSNDSDAHGVTGITLRNNHIHHNYDMGLLGHYNNFTFENNHVERNNFSGSGFSHGTYIGGGINVTLRNNLFDRNSVVNGVCQGGNMTFHGQIDGLLIEGNRIEQDASAVGGWQMSITQGYTGAEWFRNAVVRGNWFVNAGNTAMNVQSAVGVLVENNVIVNTQGTRQTAIGIGMEDRGQGDETTTGAVMRNNRAYVTNGSIAEFVMGPGSGTMAGNTVTQGLPTEQYVGFDPALMN